MKFKSIQTIIFSILTILCIALCIFILCLPMGIPSLSAPIEMSEKIQVKNLDGVPVLTGKIKNKSDGEVYLSGQCLIVSLDNAVAGGAILHIVTEEVIVIEAGQALDLSTAQLSYDEYDFLADYYALGHTFTLTGASVILDNYGPYPFKIYDRAVKEEGEIYAAFIAILGVVTALIAIFPLISYARSKRRFALAQSALEHISGGVFLRGALCRKKLGKVKPSLFSKIKGNFKSLTAGVKINTRYLNAEVMDFVITERGFYVVSSKSKTIDFADMEFFDKEELDKTQISVYGKNVVVNPLFNDNYFVFDVTYSRLSQGEITDLLSKMFEDNDEIQNVYFDENSTQKNV